MGKMNLCEIFQWNTYTIDILGINIIYLYEYRKGRKMKKLDNKIKHI